MATVDCVMCKADGDKTPASFVGTVEGKPAHYCLPCAGTMRRSGFFVTRMASDRKPYQRLTEGQRLAILASDETVRVLAALYDVKEETIRAVRKKARIQAMATAVAEQGPEAVEEAVEVPEEGCHGCGKPPAWCDCEAAPEPPAPVPAFFMPAEAPVEPQKCEKCGLGYGDGPPVGPCGYCQWKASQLAEDVKRREVADAEIAAEHSARQERNTVYATPPEPATARITLDLTHETANAIWGGLTLEEKATFCRTKIIERLMELA